MGLDDNNDDPFGGGDLEQNELDRLNDDENQTSIRMFVDLDEDFQNKDKININELF